MQKFIAAYDYVVANWKALLAVAVFAAVAGSCATSAQAAEPRTAVVGGATITLTDDACQHEALTARFEKFSDWLGDSPRAGEATNGSMTLPLCYVNYPDEVGAFFVLDVMGGGGRIGPEHFVKPEGRSSLLKTGTSAHERRVAGRVPKDEPAKGSAADTSGRDKNKK